MDERPDVMRPHGLFVPPEDDQRPIGEHYIGTLEDIGRLIGAADTLGLGWSAQGYHCQTAVEGTEEVREYRLTIWRSVMSDTLPMLSHDDEGDG